MSTFPAVMLCLAVSPPSPLQKAAILLIIGIAFSARLDHSTVSCGWGTGHTAFRLVLGCLTVIFAVALKFLEEQKLAVFWSILVLLVGWVSAMACDSAAMQIARHVCQHDQNHHGWRYYSNYQCYNDSYGVTIAVDVLMCMCVFAVWVVLCPNEPIMIPLNNEDEEGIMLKDVQ